MQGLTSCQTLRQQCKQLRWWKLPWRVWYKQTLMCTFTDQPWMGIMQPLSWNINRPLFRKDFRLSVPGRVCQNLGLSVFQPISLFWFGHQILLFSDIFKLFNGKVQEVREELAIKPCKPHSVDSRSCCWSRVLCRERTQKDSAFCWKTLGWHECIDSSAVIPPAKVTVNRFQILRRPRRYNTMDSMLDLGHPLWPIQTILFWQFWSSTLLEFTKDLWNSPFKDRDKF